MSGFVSKTVTMKNRGTTVRRERFYDHLYDPVYTVSSKVDHTRANLRAIASQNFKKVPDFSSMFSDHPNYTVKPDPAYPVPSFSDSHWRGQAEQRRQALQQLAGVVPNAQTLLKSKEYRVAVGDYSKYFKSPLTPVARQFPPDGIFALPRDDFLTTCGDDEQKPTHHTVEVQTDYRESETQTDPYSPGYVLRPGTAPSELLQLAALTWGHGLPAGLAEVEMIERARAKRAWEASLPPLNDLSQLDKRRRMMEEMEAKEWAFREQEIQKLQDARLAALKDLLKQRNEAQKDATNERLRHIYSKLQKEREAKLQKIQTDHLRSLRKLEAKWENVEGKLKRRDIVTDSHRLPTHKDTLRSENTDKFKSHYLDTYEGLEKLEASLSPWIKSSKSKDVKKVIKTPSSTALEQLNNYKALIEEENKRRTKKPLRFLVKTETPEPRPVTPRVDTPSEIDEQTELAVIFLQKVLRGRSIQYEMFKGKENNRDLMRELRTGHALQQEEKELKEADKEFVLTLKRQRNQNREKIAQEEASQARVVGVELSQLFDTLSKELVRLQEERRIHAFTLLAERERRRREAEEGGRRQVEECRRREEDEIFRQVVQVHQESVDMYLEDIILANSEPVADQQAREKIRTKAKELDDIARAMEERDSLQSEEIVSELVYSFLIPETEKVKLRQRVQLKQRKHLEAARSIIQGTMTPAGIHPQESTSSGVKTADRDDEEATGQVEQEKQTAQLHTQPEEKDV